MTTRLAGNGFAAAALRMGAAAVVWGLHFGAVYGGTALACARGVPQAAPVVVAIATVCAMVALLWVVRAGWRERAAFEPLFSASLAGFALLAVLWEAAPALWVPACGGR